MKTVHKITILAFVIVMAAVVFMLEGCNSLASDETNTRIVAEKLKKNQPTPTDIDYSLERYNLIRRATCAKRMDTYLMTPLQCLLRGETETAHLTQRRDAA